MTHDLTVNSKKYSDFYDEWNIPFDAGRWDEAIEVGIRAYQAFRTLNDKIWADASLVLVGVAIEKKITPQDPVPKDVCSFCTKQGVKVVAGPHGFICGSCAALADGILNKQAGGG